MIWRSAASPNSGPFRKSRFLATGMLVPVPGCAPSVLAEESPLLLPVEKRLILAAARAHHLQAGPHRLLYDLLKRAGDANTVTVRQVDLVEPGRVLRTVQNHLNRLEAAGWICRDHGLRTCRNGGWSSQPNTYRVFTVVERSTRLAAAEADADEALEAGEIELATVGPEDPLVRKLCAPSLEEENLIFLPCLYRVPRARLRGRSGYPPCRPCPPKRKQGALKRRRTTMPTTLEQAAAKARAINEQPWEPLPGMTKRRCPDCRYLFAVPVDLAETQPAPRCPDCAARGQMAPRVASQKIKSRSVLRQLPLPECSKVRE